MVDTNAPAEAERQEDDRGNVVFRVSARTSVQSLGGAIFNSVIEKRRTEMRCVGPGPVGQAVKATVYASQLLAGRGHCIVLKPSMSCEHSDRPEREEVTIVTLRVLCLHENGVSA